jgi:hypothetical protein
LPPEDHVFENGTWPRSLAKSLVGVGKWNSERP